MESSVSYVYLKMDGQKCNSANEADIIAEYVDFGDDGPEIPFYKVRDKEGEFKEFATNDLTEIKEIVRADKENFNY